MSHRKTMHILCIALWVYDLGPTTLWPECRWDEKYSMHSGNKSIRLHGSLKFMWAEKMIHTTMRLMAYHRMENVLAILQKQFTIP